MNPHRGATSTTRRAREAHIGRGLLRRQHPAGTARVTRHCKLLGSIAIVLRCAVSACSDGVPHEPDLATDSGVPSPPDASIDARVSIDAAIGLDASIEAGLPDTGMAPCRIASRDVCANDNVRSVSRAGLTCAGATPVFCHPYWSAEGDAGIDHCTGTAAPCHPDLVGVGLRMTFRFECDDTNDCPAGNVCTGLYSKPVNQLDGTQCTPDCVDHSADSRYQQLCKQDCECGPGSTCIDSGTCARPGAL